MASLRRCLRAAAREIRMEQGAVPPPLRAPSALGFTRREFLKGALAAGAASLLPGCAGRAAGAQTRIVIVGAGIAGLAAAHRLAKGGVHAEIFEAGPRAGGRILTLRDAVVDGQYAEAGGEFIDSSHEDMLGLAAELGLKLDDHHGEAFKALKDKAWLFGGSLRSDREVIDAVKAAAPALQPDIDALPEVIQAGTGGPAAELDRISLAEYLDKRGISGWFKDLLIAAYVTEFGLDAHEQSSLNLLTMISLDVSSGRFAEYGESDERWRVAGGNQQIVDGLAKRLEGRILTGHRLEAVSESGGAYRLAFQGPAGPVERTADAVILALPFTLLRAVDIRAELPAPKRKAIAELGYGTNSKLFLGCKSRPWRAAGHAGYFFSDAGPQSGWDHSQTQPGEGGGLTVYQGGAAGLALGKGSPVEHAAPAAAALEKAWPGLQAALNGRAGVFNWPGRPLSQGSYACYKPGQWTTLGGEEGKPAGGLLFAGEHCSADFQGYMNGGAATGRAAAESLLARAGRRA